MIAIINDTHFGARNDSPIFLEHFMEFWEKTFFPALKERGIRRVIHLGDFFDRRKYVNFHTLNQVRTRFLEPMHSMGIQMDIILGNHDVFFRNTNRVNSIAELLQKYPNIRLHSEPTTVEFDGLNIGLVPWITKDNSTRCMEFIQKCPAKILMGHFEINGYEVLRGVEHRDGMDPSVLRTYDAIYSGHFHCRHSKENIYYLGTQYQMTFADLNERKGFHILHTDSKKMEFVENPSQIFQEIVYDDDSSDYNLLNCKQYKNTFVRLIIKNKNRPIMFDNLMDRLNDAPAHSIMVVEQTEKKENNESVSVDITKDTLSLICDEIDGMDGIVDPARLKTLVREIYTESVQG